MGRVINPERAGKERNRLARSTLRAVRLLAEQDAVDDRTRDLAAYIAMALQAIDGTIDATVEAWEKRGYWVKADRYRMDWIWAGRYGKRMADAVLAEEWGTVAQVAADIAGKLRNFKELKHRGGLEPWNGAWERLRAK